MYDNLTLKEKAELIRLGVSNGIYSLKDIKNIYNDFANGGSIHIKPENRGKFTALKERTGHSTSWFIKNGTPAQKKTLRDALLVLNSVVSKSKQYVRN